MRKLRSVGALVVVPLGLVGACISNSPSPGGPGIDAGFDFDGGLDGAAPVDAGADSSAHDAGGTDAGVHDAAAPDATSDAGAADTGPGDAGQGDSSTQDSSTQDSSTQDSGAQDSSVPDSSAGDSSSADAGSVDAAPIDAGIGGIRVANLVPDGVAIDFCFIPSGGSFASATPYMSTVGVSAGLAYTQVSEYATAPTDAPYTVRIVAAGAADCLTAYAGVADTTTAGPTAINPVTVALVGGGGDASALSTLALADDGAPTAPPFGSRVRIVHAAPLDPAIDFEMGAGPIWKSPLQSGLAFGQTSSAATAASGAPTPDPAGFIHISTNSTQVTATRSGTDVTSGYDQYFGTASAFYVGSAASSTSPLGVLTCDDLQSSGHFTSCVMHVGAPTFHQLRWINLAPDSAPVDGCLRMPPSATYAALAPNLAYLTMTGPTTTYPDYTSFDAIYAPAGTSCATSVVGLNESTLTILNGLVTMIETTFTPTPGYSLVVSGSGEGNASAGSQAGVSAWNDTYGSSAPSIDLVGAPAVGLATTLLTDVGGYGSGESGELVTPGTYAFTATNAGAGDAGVLAAASGVVLGAGTTTGVFFYELADGGTLAFCSLPVSEDAGTLVTCTP
jgi:hypothetical protein